MLLKCSTTPIPRSFAYHPEARGIVLERDLAINSGRLRAKLLVFDTAKSLRRFWKRALGKDTLGPRCLGAVNCLSAEVTSFKGGKQASYIEVDPRYFCVIGLLQRHLSMEIICHESTHAGIYFANRRSRNYWDECSRNLPDEEVCYPTGKIAAAINRAVHAAGLYKE